MEVAPDIKLDRLTRHFYNDVVVGVRDRAYRQVPGLHKRSKNITAVRMQLFNIGEEVDADLVFRWKDAEFDALTVF